MPIDSLDTDPMPDSLAAELDRYVREGDGSYVGDAFLGLEGGECPAARLVEGPDEVDPGVTLTADKDTWKQLMAGEIGVVDGMMPGTSRSTVTCRSRCGAPRLPSGSPRPTPSSPTGSSPTGRPAFGDAKSAPQNRQLLRWRSSTPRHSGHSVTSSDWRESGPWAGGSRRRRLTPFARMRWVHGRSGHDGLHDLCLYLPEVLADGAVRAVDAVGDVPVIQVNDERR